MVEKCCIATFYGHEFDPTAPTADDLCIEDIAHALSYLTRANGHFRAFYSVARHSINCAKEVKAQGFTEETQLLALLHDSAEAYIGDLTRPLRRHIPAFSDFERNLQKRIYEKFATTDVTDEQRAAVKAADDALLYHEFKLFHGAELAETPPALHIPLAPDTDFQVTEAEFLALYHELKRFV
ncbi:MAG: phosphohydrolase [Clostridia bacterium]|nr:phosphohydrolase [Clostridia bacterium]